MIYDPITRQHVTIIGRFKPQRECYRFGKKERGHFEFVRVRYGEHLPGFKGGFKIGEERDVDHTSLVADEGTLEISKAVKAAPLLDVFAWLSRLAAQVEIRAIAQRFPLVKDDRKVDPIV